MVRAQRMRPVRGERDEPYDDAVLSALRVRLDGATGTVSVGATVARFEPARRVPRAFSFLFLLTFFEMCRRFSYGNYTWKNTFEKRGGVVLVVSNRTFFSFFVRT